MQSKMTWEYSFHGIIDNRTPLDQSYKPLLNTEILNYFKEQVLLTSEIWAETAFKERKNIFNMTCIQTI